MKNRYKTISRILILQLALCSLVLGKSLMLIITSDDKPVYLELQDLWRSYMHNYKKEIDVYFLKANPELDVDCLIKGDTVWARTEESLKPGILNKTLLAFEYFRKNHTLEYDFIIRTNISSMYVMPKLFDYLNTLPHSNIYAGSRMSDSGDWSSLGWDQAAGCGIIFSVDIIDFLLVYKKLLYNDARWNDDNVIGSFLVSHNIKYLYHPRYNFYSMNDFNVIKKSLPDNIFHYRVKDSIDQLRSKNDPEIYRWLLKTYYNTMSLSEN
jgi:hypothetical protein